MPLRRSRWLTNDDSLGMTPKAGLQVCGGSLTTSANSNSKDTSDVRRRLQKSERLIAHAATEREFGNISDHGGSGQDVSCSRAANPRGQDVYIRSEDIDLCSEIGEKRYNVVELVNSTNSVCGHESQRYYY